MKPDHPSVSPTEVARLSTGDDKFLLVKGIAGLGNRIFCALTAILYARLSRRTLLIDWGDDYYSSDGDNVFHRFFKSSSCSPTDEIPLTNSVYPAIWRGRLQERARRIVEEHGYNPDDARRELSIDLNKLDYQEDLVVLVDYTARVDSLRQHFNGSFQELAQMPTSAILARLLRQDLILQPEIRDRVDHFKRNHFKQRTVGVHIRFSDYRVRLFAIIRQLNALLEREGDLQIFLATDNIEIKKMFEGNYRGVVSAPHWYANPGSPIHSNRARPDRTKTAIEALIDLYLLSECDHLIFDGSSSFSRLASLLSSATALNKIDVATSGKGNRRVRGVITRALRRVRFSSWAFRLLPKVVPIRRL